MKIKIVIEDDGNPNFGFVTLAGGTGVLDLNAPLVITAIADFAVKALGDIQKQVDRHCQVLDVAEPSSDEQQAVLKTIKLRDLKLQFEEQAIPHQPK